MLALTSQASHIQVSVGGMVTAVSLDGVIVSTLGRGRRNVGSIPTLGTVFLLHISHHFAYITYIVEVRTQEHA